MNVLIVEDEVLLATELEFLLEEAGCCSLGHAMSSDEAVTLAHDLKPDLAVANGNSDNVSVLLNQSP